MYLEEVEFINWRNLEKWAIFSENSGFSRRQCSRQTNFLELCFFWPGNISSPGKDEK